MPTELWLNFTDEKGEPKRVLVEGERFAIGRTPDNDLQIALGSLSRQHAKIERFADVFIISDAGSSNGTLLNDERLEDPVALKNGDKLNFGGSVPVEVELVSDKPNNPPPPPDDDDDEEEDDSASSAASASAGSGSNSGSGGGSFPLGVLLLIPVLGFFMLLIVGGVVLIATRTKEPEVVQKDKDFVYTSNKDEDDDPIGNQKTPEKTETPTSTSTPGATTPTPSNGTATPEPTIETAPTQSNPSGDVEKTEANSSVFLRRMAQNDPRAFLSSKQVSVVSSKVSQLKSSAGLIDNLRSASKNTAKIESIAKSQNLKPQFLLIAALTKLGNQRGDVAAVAGEIAESLANISKSFGNESAEESLLVIAAYSGNISGETLQNMTGSFKNSDASARTVRTIWFLREKNKLPEPPFDFALRFLAIGTIAQNPKDFGVQADAITLN